MAIQFDAETHTYTKDGIVLPSVTTITSAWQVAVTGKLPPWDDPALPEAVKAKIELAKNLGIATHDAIKLDLTDGLDWDSIDPQIQGYMTAYKKAKAHFRLTVCKKLRVEEVLCGEGYAGTADLITSKWLIDWKTGRHDWTHWMQLAAYRHCVPGLQGACDCYLGKDGEFEIKWLEPEEYKRSWRWFWAAMDLLECRGAKTRKKSDE
jgi:hypothetical protein